MMMAICELVVVWLLWLSDCISMACEGWNVCTQRIMDWEVVSLVCGVIGKEREREYISLHIDCICFW